MAVSLLWIDVPSIVMRLSVLVRSLLDGDAAAVRAESLDLGVAQGDVGVCARAADAVALGRVADEQHAVEQGFHTVARHDDRVRGLCLGRRCDREVRDFGVGCDFERLAQRASLAVETRYVLLDHDAVELLLLCEDALQSGLRADAADDPAVVAALADDLADGAVDLRIAFFQRQFPYFGIFFDVERIFGGGGGHFRVLAVHRYGRVGHVDHQSLGCLGVGYDADPFGQCGRFIGGGALLESQLCIRSDLRHLDRQRGRFGECLRDGYLGIALDLRADLHHFGCFLG